MPTLNLQQKIPHTFHQNKWMNEWSSPYINLADFIPLSKWWNAIFWPQNYHLNYAPHRYINLVDVLSMNIELWSLDTLNQSYYEKDRHVTQVFSSCFLLLEHRLDCALYPSFLHHITRWSLVRCSCFSLYLVWAQLHRSLWDSGFRLYCMNWSCQRRSGKCVLLFSY